MTRDEAITRMLDWPDAKVIGLVKLADDMDRSANGMVLSHFDDSGDGDGESEMRNDTYEVLQFGFTRFESQIALLEIAKQRLFQEADGEVPS